MVLGTEDVTRTPLNISSESSESLDEDSGLDGHVKTTSDTCSLEWLGILELLTKHHQTRHFNLSHFDGLAAPVGELDVS